MRRQPVIGVVSGCGGAGGSTLAAVLAGRSGPAAFLLDCDPLGGGIDVLLGCERVTGPRWGQVRVRGGALDPQVLLAALPRWGDVRFLAVDRQPPDAAAIRAVVTAAATLAPTVVDLPRAGSPARTAALERCDLVLLATPAEVRGLTAAATVAAGLPAARTALVVRGSSRALPPARISELLNLPVAAELTYDRAGSSADGLRMDRVRRRTCQRADDLLARARDQVAGTTSVDAA
ncbi:MAG TPA: hypothetical protein VMB79_07945 [Jatrophihabitans sp.]|nr:hypothetical protein [Jatrophihabitans sp.]